MNEEVFRQEQADWDLNSSFYELDMESPLQRYFEEKIFRNYEVAASGQALEVGCGTGQFSRFFKQPTLVDLSPAMLAIARKRFACETLCCSAHQLALADNSFDLVFVNNSLHHFKGEGLLEPSLAELVRVAKPQARICITDRAPTFAGNFSVTVFMVLKKALRGVRGRSPGCASYHEPPFTSADYALIERFVKVERKVYWRTLPTYFFTVVTHHLGGIFGWKFCWRLQKLALPFIRFLEDHAAWPIWCTELSLVGRKR